MADSKSRDGSSVGMKKKDALEDLDIGKDFFTSWKSMSMAEEDGLDFDLSSSPKGNKKPFDFDKADMDFNLDGDFGKISSFNMDMADLDISAPLKKDGKSKEKATESSSGKNTRSSFNMDMPDLDFSPPLKNDPKSTEKPKESSRGKSKGKADCFAFTFDFDELENFSFDSSLEKEGSKAQKDKNRQENSPDGSDCQDNESSTLTRHMNIIESTSIKEDGTRKPSLPEKHVTFDMGSPLGGSADLELTRKICHSKLAVDDAVTTVQSAAVDEEASDKAKTPLKIAVVSMELPNNSLSIKLVSPTENVAVQELPSDSNNGQNGANSSEAHNKVDSTHKNGTGSNSERDANILSVAGAICNCNHAMSEDSQHLQAVAISENINNKESQALVEDNVIGGRGKPAIGQTNSLVENPSTNIAVSEILCDSSSVMRNLEPASEIHKLPLISEQADISKKQTANTIKPLVNSSRSFIQPEKPECPLLKVSKQTMFSSLSKKMGFAQPSLVEGRREMGNADGLQNGKKMNDSYGTQIKDMVITKHTIRQRESSMKELDTLRDANASQSEKKLASLSLQYSKTPLSGELPIKSQENCNRAKTCWEMGGADGLQNVGKMHDYSEIQIKDMVKTKPAIRQRESSMKELDTLSSGINEKAAKNSEKPYFLASIPTPRKASVEEHRLSSTEGGKKTTDFPGLKLTSLSLDSTKSPIQKDGRNSSKKSVLLRKTPSDIARYLDIQNQTPSKLSMKRTLEDAAANNIALHPSKRPSQSPSTIRTHVETSEKVIKLHHMEDSHIKSRNGIHHVTEKHIPHEMKTNGMEIAFSIQNDGNIKLADAYSKELDDLCNVLRKKHDEAKEILARAVVNSNKLLMLHSPQFEERIRSTQDLVGRFTINSIRG